MYAATSAQVGQYVFSEVREMNFPTEKRLVMSRSEYIAYMYGLAEPAPLSVRYLSIYWEKTLFLETPKLGAALWDRKL